MYKRILDMLMEGISSLNYQLIIKQQLQYHFNNKTEDNIDCLAECAIITKHILDDFPLNNLINIEASNNVSTKITTHTTHSKLLDNNDQQAEEIAEEIEYVITKDFLETMTDHALSFNINDWKGMQLTDVIKTLGGIEPCKWIVVTPTVATSLIQYLNMKPGNELSKSTGNVIYLGQLEETTVYVAMSGLKTDVLIGNKSYDTPITCVIDVLTMLDERSNDKKLLTRYGKLVKIQESNVTYKKISLK